MVIKGFFFDLDGTLVDTHESNFLAYRHAVKLVKSITLGDELRVVIKAGENSKSFLPKLVLDVSDNEISAINQKKKDLYPKYLNISELNEYLSVFLAQMSEHYATVLVTTAKKDNALAVLRQHNLERYFSHMIFGDDVADMKPSPASYELALIKTGLKPGEVIAFEDSDAGLSAAEAAGINTIHIRNFL
ncbi:MAG: HAD family phosphatase [Candidatus Saccharibacteria bacterium]